MLAVSSPAWAAPVTALPPSLNYPSTGTGAVSPPQTTTFTNNSNGNILVSALALVGANAADFQVNGVVAPVQLAPGGSIAEDVTFAPLTGGAKTAALRATLTQNGQPAGTVDVPLTGTAIGPMLTVMPNPINGGAVKINGKVVTSITVANSGGGVVKVSSVALGGANANEFGTSQVNVPVNLGPNQSFNVDLTFIPAFNGVHNASLIVTSNDPNNPVLTVPIRALAGDPAIGVDVNTLIYGSVRVGLASNYDLLVISNSGNSDLHIDSISLLGNNAGDFVDDLTMLPQPVNNQWVVAAGTSVKVGVKFKPTGVGQRTATLVLRSDDPGTPSKAVTLIGTGTIATLSLVTKDLQFGDVKVFAASTPQSIIITNAGSGAANITGAMVVGPEATWFRLPANFMAPVVIPAGGGQAKIDITALPLAGGKGTAMIQLLTDEPQALSFTVMATVNAVGSQIEVAPSFADFGCLGVLQTGMQVVNIKNNGTATLNVSGFELLDPNGPFTLDPGMPQLPIMLMPGDTFPVKILFTAPIMGSFVGELDLISDDPLAKFVHVPLDGCGAAAGFSVSPMNLNFNMVPVGRTSLPQTVTVSNTGAVPVTITSVAATGASNQFTISRDAVMDNSTLAPGVSRTIQVLYTPVSSGVHAATLVVTPVGFAAAKVNLMGSALSPVLQVANGQMALDFGEVRIPGTSDPIEVHLRNAGQVPLTINSITPSDSVFVADLSNTKLALAPSGMTSFLASFKPAVEGTKSGTIAITVEGLSGPVVITVTGKGLPALPQISRDCTIGAHRSARGDSLLIALVLAPLALLATRRRRRH